MLRKIVSGGQTGVDRAGLDSAAACGLATGGYCPKGRLAEDGTIPPEYRLTEMASPVYIVRTEKNVVESDGTLILNIGEVTEGTKATHEFALKHGRPALIVQLDAPELTAPEEAARWIEENGIVTLNVAGPRESKYPGGIYAAAFDFLEKVFGCIHP
ncbi:putative molybdenum carrier protein [Geomonas sp. Red32]|uniref:putative molybdenum carrier protein n=1 Tax=Geomonas sp. Red32 TaxID=2912856 RepID=UPI00202CC415|nr:putative molybdenum carrier protein [Geomonas sp. Red32]MCM0082463.1 putative molybdenum carrier protein [Geomonas sp. Red32]